MVTKLNSAIGILVILGIVIFGNIVVNKINMRVDVTEDNLFTLSQGTENILGTLEDDVTLTFYFSKSLEGADEGEKIYAKRVQDMLEEYKLNSSKITLKIIDPEPDSEEEELAQRYGIAPRPTPYGEKSYFGLVVSNFSGEEAIKRFDPQREKFLEYDITRAIYLLNSSDNKLKIGVLSSVNVLGDDPPPQQQFGQPPPPQQEKPWLFTMELSRMYDVQKIADDVDRIPDDLNLLVVMHGKNLSEKTEYAIDQYVMSGKNVIFMVDPHFLRESQNQNQFRPPAPNTSFAKIFPKWGIDFEHSKIALDPSMAVPTRQGKHPAVLQVNQTHVSKEDPTTAQLNQIFMLFPGSVRKKDGVDVEFIPLIQTTAEAKTEEKFKVMYTQPDGLMRDLKGGGEVLNVAGLFVGQFKSAFDKAPEGVSGTYQKESPEGVSLMVITDIDMFENQYCIQPVEMFGQVLGYRPLNQNSIFFNNAVERMVGNKDLISLRSRGEFRRPFIKVQDLENEARKKYQEEESKLQKKVSELQDKINERLKKVDPSQNTIISSTVQEEIENFKKQRLEIGRQLREVRRKLRSSIEELGIFLKTINILLLPVLIGLFGTFIAFRKSRRVGT